MHELSTETFWDYLQQQDSLVVGIHLAGPPGQREIFTANLENHPEAFDSAEELWNYLQSGIGFQHFQRRSNASHESKVKVKAKLQSLSLEDIGL